MPKVLIIEDDRDVSSQVSQWLAGQKFTVEETASGGDALQLLESFKYDLIILDFNLPDMTGDDICRAFRKSGGNTPVLMLTGESDMMHKRAGFDSGVDDYLTKPFSLEELTLRLNALSRRIGSKVVEVLQVGDLMLNPKDRTVVRASSPIKLFPKEFSILELLMRHSNEVVRTDELLAQIWRSDEGASSETLRTCISRLRNKLGDSDSSPIIENVPAVGYIIRIRD